jgi:hypothetical protein
MLTTSILFHIYLNLDALIDFSFELAYQSLFKLLSASNLQESILISRLFCNLYGSKDCSFTLISSILCQAPDTSRIYPYYK